MATERLLAYLAGLFDGEGCVTIICDKTRTRHFRLQAYIAMQNREAVNLFAETFHGTVRNSHSQTWRSRYHCAKAAVVLEQLLPYLIVKRDMAELAIYFQGLRKKTHPRRTGYSPEERERDACLREQMLTLVHRDSLAIRKALKQQA